MNDNKCNCSSDPERVRVNLACSLAGRVSQSDISAELFLLDFFRD